MAGTPLESLPHIGPALASGLRDVGIADAETLRAVGALAAWDELYDAGRFHCLSSLSALAAAVAGMPRSTLDPLVKDDLRAHHRASTAARRGRPTGPG